MLKSDINILPIESLKLDNRCKSEKDAYQVAFYKTGHKIEKKITQNTERNNCNKFRIVNLDWLEEQDLFSKPDIIIINLNVKLTEEEEEIIEKHKIKQIILDEKNLNIESEFQIKIREIEEEMYKQKTKKYIKFEKKRIGKIEEKHLARDLKKEEIIDNIIDDVLDLIKEKDEITYIHAKNVSKYVDIYVEGMPEDEKFNDEQIEQLKKAALLHDMGKLILPSQILNSEEKLNDIEYNCVKEHVGKDAYLIKYDQMSVFEKIVLCHHERYDGKGYPMNLKGKEIHIFSRILSVIDTFEALTGERRYSKSINWFDVIKILVENSGTQFDPDCVEYFITGVFNNKIFQSEFSQGNRPLEKRLVR